jgi:multiple sugar transport system permease protein
LRIFLRIAMPLARAPLIAATVIVFTLDWNNFLWPLLITFDDSMKTLPVGIAAFAPVVGSHTQLEGYAVAMAAVTLLCIPSVLLFLLLQRYFVAGLSAGGLKG